MPSLAALVGLLLTVLTAAAAAWSLFGDSVGEAERRLDSVQERLRAIIRTQTQQVTGQTSFGTALSDAQAELERLISRQDELAATIRETSGVGFRGRGSLDHLG